MINTCSRRGRKDFLFTKSASWFTDEISLQSLAGNSRRNHIKEFKQTQRATVVCIIDTHNQLMSASCLTETYWLLERLNTHTEASSGLSLCVNSSTYRTLWEQHVLLVSCYVKLYGQFSRATVDFRFMRKNNKNLHWSTWWNESYQMDWHKICDNTASTDEHTCGAISPRSGVNQEIHVQTQRTLCYPPPSAF